MFAADVDDAVLQNRASDQQLIIDDGQLNLPKDSVDLIIADYVLEHVDDPQSFATQIDRCLKSGGWFCARTPHKYSYVSIAASMVKNSAHASVLKIVQPERKAIDVFPTAYKLNTMSDLKNTFPEWEHHSFIFRTSPSYYFGSQSVYKAQSFLHRLMPSALCGNIFVFVKKP